MEDFFDLRTVPQARETLLSALRKLPSKPLGTEDLDLLSALGRVLASDIVSPEDIPPHPRSTVDGYAVAAKDTFGASETLPAILEVIEEVPMGEIPRMAVLPGKTSRISTGGVLPEGADACVMVEYTELLDDSTVLVQKPVSPGENVIQAGEDVRHGEVLLEAGRVLSPYDLGALAAIGMSSVPVLRKPRVAVVSTGDEIVPPERRPEPGQIRDINTYSLSASLATMGAVPLPLGIAPDTYGALRALVEEGLALADAVVVSGGSSVGARDNTLKVFSDLGPPGVLIHGVAVRPGKPVILAICRDKPVFGLPGHPVSALVALGLFARSALDAMTAMSLGLSPDSADSVLTRGLQPWRRAGLVQARLTRSVSSVPGREDHVRVRLVDRDGELFAEPVLGKSGLISTMVRSDGEIVVPFESEGFLEGSLVSVRLDRR